VINAATKMMSLVDMMAHRNNLINKLYARYDAASNTLRGLFLQGFRAIQACAV
jgi:hypothetical protein